METRAPRLARRLCFNLWVGEPGCVRKSVRCDPYGLGGARRLEGGGGDEEKMRLVASLPSCWPSRWPRSLEAEAIEALTLRVGGGVCGGEGEVEGRG